MRFGVAGKTGAQLVGANCTQGRVAALVALTYQRLTGNGTHVDLSHLEAAIPFNFQVFLDHTANGVIRPRLGNTEGCAGPQGCYPCRGDNRSIALSCPDDAASVRLSKLIGFDGTRPSGRRRPDHRVDLRAGDRRRRAAIVRGRYPLRRRAQRTGPARRPAVGGAGLLPNNHASGCGHPPVPRQAVAVGQAAMAVPRPGAAVR